MTDSYAREIDELFGNPSDRLRQVMSPAQFATQQGVADVDEDPDAAARAIQLSRATGTPAPVIHGDVESFEREHKQRLVGEMLRNSEVLQDYVASYPMASKVSNDDWPNLEEIHKAVTRGFGPFGVSARTLPALWEGIKEGWGDGQTMGPEDWNKLFNFFPTTGKGAVGAAVLGVFGESMTLLSHALRAGIHGLAKAGAAHMSDTGMVAPGDERAAEKEIGSFLEWITNRPGVMDLGLAKVTPKDLSRSVERAKPYLDANEIPPPGVDPWLDYIKSLEAESDLKNLQDLQKAVKQSKTFERSPDAGEEFLKRGVGDRQIGISADAVFELYGGKRPAPDDGLLGWVSDLEQQMATAITTGGDIKVPLAGFLARMDPAVAKQLEEFIRLQPEGLTKFEAKEVKEPTEFAMVAEEPQAKPGTIVDKQGTSYTVEKSHPGNIDIYTVRDINGEQVAYALMEEHGTSVNDVAVSDELRRRGLATALYDYIEQKAGQKLAPSDSVLPDGQKFWEARRKRDAEQELRTAEDLARKEAGFEPLAQVGDTGVRLRLDEIAPYVEGDTDPVHIFTVLKNNEEVGYVHARVLANRPNVLRIEDISTRRQGIGQGGPWDLGGHGLVELFTQLVKEFPGVTRIGGYRVSGTRSKMTEKAGRDLTGWVERDLPKAPQELAQFFGDLKGWDSVETSVPKEPPPPGTITEKIRNATVEYRPNELFIKNEAAIFDAIQKIVGQLAPGLPTAVVDTISVKAAGMETSSQVHALYGADRDVAKAFILVSFRNNDPIGSALHEVIHHLRSGFFTRDEWSMLEKAANDGNWTKKHSSKSRYPEAPEWLLLEEAIAEEYREWAGERFLKGRQPAEVVAIFERLKELFKQLADALKQALGQYASVDQLFTRVSSGEVGSRKPSGIGGSRFASMAVVEKIESPIKSVEPKHQPMLDQAYRLGLKRAREGRHGESLFDTLEEKMYADDLETDGKEIADKEARRRAEDTEAYNRGLLDGSEQSGPFAMFAQATAAEEQAMFAKGAAVGMTQDQFKRYMLLMDQKRIEIEERAQRRADRAVAVTKTEQWKENEPRVREEVTLAIDQRPDIMADDFFRRGILNGEKVTRPKFGTEFLTPEQQKDLGPGLHREGGANPNDMAGVFGYFSGEDMVNAIAGLNKARTEAGMSPQAWKNRLVREATDRRMMKEYGLPEHDALLREAREDIITETQMDMLAEETMALATKTGQAPTFDKGQLKASVKQAFGQSKMVHGRDMEGFLRAAGKAGREAELALLKGDPTEAFRQKQRQYIATLYADEAKALSKQEARLEKTAKRLAPREVKNLDHEYVDYAQSLLRQAGYAGRRDLAELDAALSKNGFADFQSFIASKQADGWEISAPSWVLAGVIPKVDEMTTSQFREFKDVVDSLVHTARESKQVLVAGEKMDFEAWKVGVRENIRSLNVRDPDAPTGIVGRIKNALWRMDASLTKVEEVVRDLDLREELGPLYGAVMHPVMDAKHTEFTMQERLTKDLEGIRGFGRKWRKSLDDNIPNDFFRDPYYDNDVPFELNRADLIGIMLNWGNRSNIKKFTEGYAGKDGAAALEIHLRQLMVRYATKEDWQFVQKVWDTFETIRKDSDTMYYRMSGVSPKWIGPEALQTAHGNFAGGYFPIFFDPMRSRQAARMDGSYLNRNYQQSTTSNHYTIERTDYADRIQFRGAVDLIASRYQQMIHDISHREALLNAQKVLKDQDIRGDIRKHYGPEYLEQLDYTFKNLANHFNLQEQQLSFWQDWMRKARFNVVVNALGFNLRVILSPATGKFGPRDLPSMLGNWDENHKLAMEKSKELPHTFRNLDRDFRERLEDVSKNSKWSSFQNSAFKWAMSPTVWVDQQFRVMTFVNEYKGAKAKGLSEGDAISIADAAVRQRHGAAGMADLAPILQSTNEGMKLATLFYGFFSTMYNWQRQIAGNVRRGEYTEALAKGWWSVLVPSIVGATLFNSAKEDDSIFKIGAKGIVLQLASTLPLGREMANLFIEGHPSRSPWGSIIQALKSTAGDVTGKPDPRRKTVQHTANVVGLTMGLPLGQIGRTSQFIADVNRGRQHPRNIMEYIRGIIHGEARLKKGGS